MFILAQTQKSLIILRCCIIIQIIQFAEVAAGINCIDLDYDIVAFNICRK